MAYQDRVLLLIEKDPQFEEIKDILKSPLNLVSELVKSCFSNDAGQSLLKYEQELDTIKKRVAGITRARNLSSYKIAEYSSYLFAFQQFFHSSYRARQGEVLEAVVYYSLKSAKANPSKEKETRKKIIKSFFGIRNNVRYDIDFLAKKQNSILIGQIRSTDITGGTTAKGSLVDLLRFILREKRFNRSARYLIVVWEPLERQQKQSLINKIWDSLRSELGLENEIEFKGNIDRGWVIQGTNIYIRLVYGTDDLGDELNKFTGNNIAKAKLLSLWESIQRWDDLWLTYAISSLELQNLILKGFTNFQLLERKLQQIGISISDNDIENYKISSTNIAERLALEWNENTLPVTAPSDILNYIRDLVLLKMIHMRVTSK